MSKEQTPIKDLDYYKSNAEEDYITTPISVLRYISELENNAQAKVLEAHENLEKQLLEFLIWSIRDERPHLSVSDMDELKKVIKLYIDTEVNQSINCKKYLIMKEPKKDAYFEFSHWDEVVRITLDHHDITIDEAFEKFERLLIASGFDKEQIDNYLRNGDE